MPGSGPSNVYRSPPEKPRVLKKDDGPWSIMADDDPDTDGITGIDDLEYAVLRVIDREGAPLWKKQIHREINDHLDELPLLESFSPQTVGRRVDDLQNAELLEPSITSPDDIGRDVIIAYRLTEMGREALQEKHDAYVRNIVRTDIFKELRKEDAPIERLVNVLADEFTLSEAAKDVLRERYSSIQLPAILAMYHIEQEAKELFDDEERRILRDTLDGSDTMDEAIRELGEYREDNSGSERDEIKDEEKGKN